MRETTPNPEFPSADARGLNSRPAPWAPSLDFDATGGTAAMPRVVVPILSWRTGSKEAGPMARGAPDALAAFLLGGAGRAARAAAAARDACALGEWGLSGQDEAALRGALDAAARGTAAPHTSSPSAGAPPTAAAAGAAQVPTAGATPAPTAAFVAAAAASDAARASTAAVVVAWCCAAGCDEGRLAAVLRWCVDDEEKPAEQKTAQAAPMEGSVAAARVSLQLGGPDTRSAVQRAFDSVDCALVSSCSRTHARSCGRDMRSLHAHGCARRRCAGAATCSGYTS
jgi:hypothetical protein